MCSILRYFYVGLFFVFLLASSTSWALCTYNISGRVMVSEDQSGLSGLAEERPLPEAKIRVQGNTVSEAFGGPVWSAGWGTYYADSNGYFNISKQKTCVNRQVRVSVKLNNSKIQVFENLNDNTANWVVIGQTSFTGSRNLDFGNRIFGEGDAVNSHVTSEIRSNLNNTNKTKRASIWYYLWKAMEEIGFSDFTKKTFAVYPTPDSHNDGISHADYIANSMHLTHDGLDTVLHELMHLWTFQNTNYSSICGTNDESHGEQTCHSQAFEEGLAMWGASMLRLHIWHTYLDPPIVYPYHRDALQNIYGLANFSMLVRQDNGIKSAISVLTLDDVHKYHYQDSIYENLHLIRPVGFWYNYTCPNVPTWTFHQVLSAFDSHSSLSLPKFQISNRSDLFDDFIERMEVVYDADLSIHTQLMDPAATLEPIDSCEYQTNDQSANQDMEDGLTDTNEDGLITINKLETKMEFKLNQSKKGIEDYLSNQKINLHYLNPKILERMKLKKQPDKIRDIKLDKYLKKSR